MYKPITTEGVRMFQSLESNRKEPPKPPTKPRKLDLRVTPEMQVEFFVKELHSMIENSKNVVTDCENILNLCTTKDEYLKNDCKVALLIHSRLIIRYSRLLNWESAFERL